MTAAQRPSEASVEELWAHIERAGRRRRPALLATLRPPATRGQVREAEARRCSTAKVQYTTVVLGV